MASTAGSISELQRRADDATTIIAAFRDMPSFNNTNNVTDTSDATTTLSVVLPSFFAIAFLALIV
ncbi:hypothetical protein LTR16_001550, partial [Cryomyces antarcticus]